MEVRNFKYSELFSKTLKNNIIEGFLKYHSINRFTLKTVNDALMTNSSDFSENENLS